MNPSVDLYLEEGCGRCDKYRTPECKAIIWNKELSELRRIVLECGLKEEYKWKQPCYTINDKNVLMVSAFNDYPFISFFKGSLLKDDLGILVAPGKNSQSDRRIKVLSVDEIQSRESIIKEYIFEAIELEKAGLKVQRKKNPEPMPEELINKMEDDKEYKEAFESLTPGRQRSYILYFNSAKQSATRTSRVEKAKEKILSGKGWNEY